MRNFWKKKFFLTLSFLIVLAGVLTFFLASQSFSKESSAPTVTKNSSPPTSKKEAGRDSFPDEQTYLSYKKMRDEVNKGEVIVEQSDPKVPNRKNFVGTKSELNIENWSLEKDNSGTQLLKVPFKFINKTNDKVDLKKYIKTRITSQQLVSQSLHSLTDLTIKDYPAQIIVGAKDSYSGFLYIKLVQNQPNFGVTLNLSYVSGGKTNRGGGAVLHDLRENPSF